MRSINRQVSKLLKSAAMYVDADRHCSDKYKFGACEAIWEVQHLTKQAPLVADAAGYALQLFRPPHRRDTFWWGNPLLCTDEQHNARVMALLLAAEMVKDWEIPND